MLIYLLQDKGNPGIFHEKPSQQRVEATFYDEKSCKWGNAGVAHQLWDPLLRLETKVQWVGGRKSISSRSHCRVKLQPLETNGTILFSINDSRQKSRKEKPCLRSYWGKNLKTQRVSRRMEGSRKWKTNPVIIYTLLETVPPRTLKISSNSFQGHFLMLPHDERLKLKNGVQ